jgi:hypothetical protein
LFDDGQRSVSVRTEGEAEFRIESDSVDAVSDRKSRDGRPIVGIHDRKSLVAAA